MGAQTIGDFFLSNIVKYQVCMDTFYICSEFFSELRMACFLMGVESQDICQEVLLNVLCSSKVQ